MARDLYAELGLSREATAAEIKKAYRARAAKMHPDRHPGDAKAEAKFKELNAAHQVLSDEKKRKLYDEFGEVGLRDGFDANAARAYSRGGGGRPGLEDLFSRGGAGGQGAAAGIGDIFGDLFGSGGRRRARKAADVQSEISIEFVSAVGGAELELSMDGGQHQVKVRIPKGADDGDRLRVQGGGQPGGPGMPAGDLVLTLRVKPHPFFSRDGLDLTLELPITPVEAFAGGKVEVPTPTGNVTLKVPAHAQSGQLLRLRDRGVWRGEKKGDLYVRFLIKLPLSDEPELGEALAIVEKFMGADLRAAVKY